jgi:hypothetical protein
MISEPRGNNTYAAEVTSVGRDGFWLLVNDRELFVPYQNYPVFRSATVEQIYALEEIAPGQLRWEALDIDLEIEAVEYPERFPLQFREH